MKSLLDISKIIIKKLEKNGFEAYVVGGFVRNILMNIPPSDIDICTNALPSEIKAAFSDFKVIETGISHGTVTVVLENENVEITTYRIDGEYIGHRKPACVTFTPSLKEDLSRRDFTINAMALDFANIFDPFGGQEDLKNKIIRCVGNAEKRFLEDALRILRALRFSAVLGFKIEEETKNAILKLYKLLRFVSKERITDEFLKLLKGGYAKDVLLEFSEVFLFLTGADTKSIAEKMHLYSKEGTLALFPDTDFLLLPSKQEKRINFLRENLNTDIKSRENILMLLSKHGLENVSFLINSLKNDRAEKTLSEILRNGDCFNVSMLKVSGDDLIRIGYRGKEIGKKLCEILELVIKNQLKNKRETLISYAEKNIF